MLTFQLTSDNWFRVLSVTNAKDGSLISSATVQLTAMKDRNGVAVSGGSSAFPYTLAAIAGTPGGYEVLLPHDLPVQRGVVYTASITIDGGAGLYAYREESVEVDVQS